MTASKENKSLNLISEEAHKTMIAKPYTWAQIRQNIIWNNVIKLTFYHVGFAASMIFYGFGLRSIPLHQWTIHYAVVMAYGSGLGVTAGAHRLWTHRAYKANLYLRIILMLAYSVAGMNSIFHWVKDHRVHHKFSETDADPHNARRGFFFAHVGWLMLKRHPAYIVQARRIDMTDILADPVVMFNKKYEPLLKPMFSFVIPTLIPVLFWGETILNAVLTCLIRYVIVLNFTWSVNSAAHLWGGRPYNRFINPAENLLVSLLAIGEGSHNYHHTFPWDYKTSEFPYFNFNPTTLFIDGMAKLGWAWDRRVASPEFIKKVTQRFGHKCQVDEVFLN